MLRVLQGFKDKINSILMIGDGRDNFQFFLAGDLMREFTLFKADPFQQSSG